MRTQALALPAARRSRTLDFVTLTKPRVNTLVVASTLAGYYMAAGDAADLPRMINTAMGTWLVAGGAAALNQVYERDLDALMRRTRLRPLPDGRLQPVEARLFAIALAGGGLLQLAVGANLLAALVALATLVIYAAVYTPLKRHTSLATVVGAVPGALPPMIGWAAAQGSLPPPAWALFTILFLWQLPHFLAIAWIYRDDYARAGFPMLPVLDPAGHSTARQSLLYAAALLPVSLAPTALGIAGATYFVSALALSTVFLVLAARFGLDRSLSRARHLFLASIIYLPLLWILMIADRA
jgi:protoheme IX farnesyltransferase